MAVLALTSAKGAPGVSTAALAMTLLWPRAALLADPLSRAGSPQTCGSVRTLTTPGTRSVSSIAASRSPDAGPAVKVTTPSCTRTWHGT